MVATTDRSRLSRLGPLAVLVALGLAVGPPAAGAQAAPLPRIEGALTMAEAVEIALGKSPRVRAAEADRQVMESMRREAQAPFWPQVSVNGYLADQTMMPNVYSSAGSTMAQNVQVFGAERARDVNVTGMYSLFAGGRDYFAYKAAVARAGAAREMLRGTELEVAMQARLDYLAAQRETAEAEVTAKLLQQVDERLRVGREMLAAGRIPRFYVLRDEAELANAAQMHAMARSRAERALVALKTTLGVDLESPVSLAEPLAYTPVAVSVEDGIRESTLGHPELAAAVRQREAAEAEQRAARGSYFPQVSVAAMYDWARVQNRGEPSTSDNGYSVGLVVTLPVFDGFMRENAVRTAKARADRALHGETLVRQQIARDVTQAALMLGAADKSVEAAHRGLDRAEEEARIVRERFEAGRGIHVEVLDSQVSLTRARFNVVAALAEHQTALAMWLKATGRLR